MTTNNVEPVAWCNDRVLRGDVGECASAAAIRYWSKGDWVDKRRVEDMKHPLVPASALAALQAKLDAMTKADVEPCAYMYPDDYERMTTTETFCTVYSVPCGSPTQGKTTVELVPASALAVLRTQLAEAQADAARYRWLRPLSNEQAADYLDQYSGEDLDAAIDAAMKGTK